MKWFQLDWEKLNPARQNIIQGVEVETYYSYLDVPESLGFDCNERTSVCTFFFKYVYDLGPLAIVAAPPISIGVAEKTRRIQWAKVNLAEISEGLLHELPSAEEGLYSTTSVGGAEFPQTKPAVRDELRMAVELVQSELDRCAIPAENREMVVGAIHQHFEGMTEVLMESVIAQR